VPVHSPLYFIEIKARVDGTVDLSEQLFGESALYVLEGELKIDGQTFHEKQILVTEEAQLCSFQIKAGSTAYIFGGEPFAEPRYMDWNFVSSSKERLAQAKADWLGQKFPKINAEDEFVPYPGSI
jgi:redox-sensitive bicupin YhaK (pirin superfamily)